MRRILCIFLCVALLLTCVSLPAFAAGYDGFRIESLEQYCVHSEELAKDGYIGIPVGIKTYAKGNSTAQSQVFCMLSIRIPSGLVRQRRDDYNKHAGARLRCCCAGLPESCKQREPGFGLEHTGDSEQGWRRPVFGRCTV